MKDRKTPKKTIDQKLLWLKNKKIIKKEKPTKTTINRLYSYYHRNPLSTPLYVAYGLHKRIERNVNIYGDTYELQTPVGKITAKKYIQKTAKTKAEHVQKRISYQASFQHSRYKRYMKRVQDYLIYYPNITINEENLEKKLAMIQKNLLPVIKKDVHIIARNFQTFYKTTLIGSVTTFQSHDFPQGIGYNYQRLGFIRLYRNKYREYLNFFIDELYNTLRLGFILIHKYDKMNITLQKIEIIFTSDEKASMYEKLRIQ